MQARKRLDASASHGLYQDFARGLDDALHGKMTTASDHFLRSAAAARLSDDPDAPLFARFAVERAVSLQSDSEQQWKRWEPWVLKAIEEPGHLGWRARDTLVQWWASRAWTRVAATPRSTVFSTSRWVRAREAS